MFEYYESKMLKHNLGKPIPKPINSRYQGHPGIIFFPDPEMIWWPPGQSDRCSRCRSRQRLERFSQVDGTTREIFGILGRAAVCWDYPVQTQGFVSFG